jgi:hypothetical protein
MENLNNRTLLPLTAALFIGATGILINIIKHDGSATKLIGILFLLIFVLITLIFLFLIYQFDETRKTIVNLKNGFAKITDKQAFEEMEFAIFNAGHKIRVIGNGYESYSKGNRRYSNLIKNYFSKIEDRLHDNSNLIYHRITSRNIDKDSFLTLHLRKVLDMDSSKAKVSFLPYFEAAYNYIIIDNKTLIIHIPDERYSNELEDCFITKNAEIIENYENHFEKIWDKQNPIKTSRQMEYEITKGKLIWKIFKQWNNIPFSIKNGNHESFQKDFTDLLKKYTTNDPE